MRTALRKMGNSTGMILPKAILGQLGVETGTTMDLVVEGNRIIATPVEQPHRAGWAEAATAIAETADPEADIWGQFGNENDADLTW